MHFNPQEITREHVLRAVERIEKNNIDLIPSTKFDVLINDKLYPPKEIMRYAHEEMNGENIWELSGGSPTNKYLKKMGFEIIKKKLIKEGAMFDWIPIYKEIAANLISYKGRSNKLVELIQRMKKDGLSVISVNDFDDELRSKKIILEEIDPFTFMANFNRGVGIVKRLEILNFLKKEWGLTSNIPTGFDGVPVVTNMKTWFFAFKYERKQGDIELLWALFIEAFTKEISDIDEKLFNSCLNIKGVLSNITMGLYWMNPDKFMTLDTNSRVYLKKHFQFEKVGIVKLKFEGYKELISFLSKNSNKTFYELSRAAWEGVHLNGGNEEDNEHEIVTEDLPLNRILYGPPGTGKTYNTKNIALSILGEDIESLNRNEILELYKQYSEEGRIEFVTFHQSFGYEDFVEGIKPVLPGKGENDTDEMVYDIENGIFKSLCRKASQKSKVAISQDYNPDEIRYFKMSLGGKQYPIIHNWCVENGYLALGWGGDKDFSNYTNIENWISFRDKFKEEYPNMYSQSKFTAQALHIFMKMNEGDIVIATKGNYIVNAIGRVAGPYEYKEDTPIDFYQFRKVNWIIKDLDSPADEFVNKNISQQSIYQFSKEDLKKEYLKRLITEDDVQKGNYVLIIDEINRGNIASIFGELITLIEVDKRKGATEELSAVLPYSKEKFSVPDNLFIIGTMNTADRNVEALDTALRRRFAFEEIKSQPKLINPSSLVLGLWQKYEKVKNWYDEPFYSRELSLYNFLGFDSDEFEVSEKYHQKLLGKEWYELDFPNEITMSEFNGFRPDLMLETINNRIELLLDQDHCIGHSYFMSLMDCEDHLQELKDIFQNKIIPLLREYFYGSPYKIGLVLGSAFVKRKDTKKFNFAKDFTVDDSEINDKEVFEFIIPEDMEAYQKIYED